MAVGFRPNPAAVRLHNRPANGQAPCHAVGFCCVKWFEDLRQFIARYARAAVGNGHLDGIFALSCFNRHASFPIGQRLHGLESVSQQIKQTPVGFEWQSTSTVGRFGAISQVTATLPWAIFDWLMATASSTSLAHRFLADLGFAFEDEITHALHDCGGALRLIGDFAQRLVQFTIYAAKFLVPPLASASVIRHRIQRG